MLKQRGGKRILILCVLIAVAISLCVPAAFAEYEITYEGGDKPFLIIGETDIAKQNQTVTLRVTDDNDNTLFIKQTLTDIDGSYSFAFDIGKNGKANILVMEEDKEAVGDKQIYKSTPSEAASVIARLNSSEDIDKVITEESEILGVDPEEYGKLKANRIFLNYLEKQKYNDLQDFSDAYRTAKFLVMVSKNADLEEIEKLGDKIIASADLEERNAGEIFEAMSDSDRAKIYKELNGNTYESLEDYYDGLCVAIIMKELNEVGNYSDKYSVIADNNDFLGLNLGYVSNLGYKQEDFKKDLADAIRGAKTADDIKSAFNDLRQKYDKAGSGSGSGSGSGGGSGKSGGSGSKSESVKVSDSLMPDTQYPELSYFKDLDGYDWAREAISALASKGIVRGRESLIFVPGDNVTRAEFVKIVMAAFKLPANSESAIGFADVPESFWGYNYIMAASQAGVVKGISETEFNPNGYISRQDMAVICCRILEILKKELTAVRDVKYDDEETIAPYAKDSVLALSNAGVLNGKGNNRFDPYGLAIRAEAAQMVYGILKATD